jgi:transcriptional regulator with XRE-family HTH domain
MLGQRIKELRDHRDYSQQALGDIIGAHRSAVNHIEHATKRATITQIDRIAEALEYPVKTLMQPPGSPIPRDKGRKRFRRPHYPQGSFELIAHAKITTGVDRDYFTSPGAFLLYESDEIGS